MTNKEQKPLPALRFPEFDGDWELHKLGEFIDERKDVASSDLPLYSLTIESGVVPKSKRYERSFLVKSEDGAYKRMKPKDFAYNPMNLRWGALACHHGDKEVAVSKYYDVFSVNEKSVPGYLEPFLTSYTMVQFYDRMSTGTLEEKKRVHYLDFVHFKKFFPTLPEQQKIADFLTAVDGRIGQLIQKKALLEHYKKGVMQQLFTQAIRFKDDHGNDFPDWEEKKLGEVSHNVMYGMNAAATEFDGVTKYIRITDIDEGSNRFRPDPVTSPDGEAGDQYKLHSGDIVFARTGASVGKSYLYDEADGNLAFAGFLIRFSIREDSAHPVFIFFQTQTHDYWKWVKVNSMRSGQPGINAEEYKMFPVHLPSIPEQTKIADFFSAIDRKIENVVTQITEIQTFKRGLLQQMFV